MLNEEFLNGVLGNEGVSAEDKVRQILTYRNIYINV